MSKKIRLYTPGVQDNYYLKLGKQILNDSVGEVFQFLPKTDITLSVAGGVFKSYMAKEPPRDIDIFILDSYDKALSFMRQLRQTLLSSNIINTCSEIMLLKLNLDTNIEKSVIKFDVNCISSDNTVLKLQFVHIQHIKNGETLYPMSGSELITLFDFVPCCFAVDLNVFADKSYSLTGVSYHPLLLESLINKELIPNITSSNSIPHVMTLKRLHKYLKVYGFSISNEHMETMSSYLKIPLSFMHAEYDDDGSPIEEEIPF